MERQPGKYEQLRNRIARWTGDLLYRRSEAQQAAVALAKNLEQHYKKLHMVRDFQVRTQISQVLELLRDSDRHGIEHTPLHIELRGATNVEHLQPIMRLFCGEERAYGIDGAVSLARNIQQSDDSFGDHLKAVRHAATLHRPSALVYADYRGENRTQELLMPTRIPGVVLGVKGLQIEGYDAGSTNVGINFYFSFSHPENEPQA